MKYTGRHVIAFRSLGFGALDCSDLGVELVGFVRSSDLKGYM